MVKSPIPKNISRHFWYPCIPPVTTRGLWPSSMSIDSLNSNYFATLFGQNGNSCRQKVEEKTKYCSFVSYLYNDVTFTLDDCHNIKKRQNWKSVAFLVCLSVYKSEQTVAQSLRLNNLTYRKLWWYSLSSSKSVNTPFTRYFMILALKQHFRVPKSVREGSIANCTPLEF